MVLLAAAGAAGPFFLLPYDRLTHTCVDPFAFKSVLDYESERFASNAYATGVTVFTYVLPVSQEIMLSVLLQRFYVPILVRLPLQN